MDDPPSTPQNRVAMTDEALSLDAMTAELKPELALQELSGAKADDDSVRRTKAALDALDECLEELHPPSAKRKLTCALQRAKLALNIALGRKQSGLESPLGQFACRLVVSPAVSSGRSQL
jgi:hypothetical protein